MASYIVLLGPPGVGKGTQAEILAERTGLPHISSGDLFRENMKNRTELGKQAQAYMDSGALVPDDLIIGMMKKAVDQAPKAGYVLDGFPRTVNQAVALDQVLTAAGSPLDKVINLEVNDAIIADRMSGRRSCPACGAVLVGVVPDRCPICATSNAKFIEVA